VRFLTRAEFLERRGETEILRLAGSVNGVPNHARVDAAIVAAEAEGVSYLLGRYGTVLPAAPGDTPGVLKDKLAVIAHRQLATGSYQVANALEADVKDARDWLLRAARGLVDLGIATAPQVDQGGAQILVSQPNPRCRALTFETLKDM